MLLGGSTPVGDFPPEDGSTPMGDCPPEGGQEILDTLANKLTESGDEAGIQMFSLGAISDVLSYSLCRVQSFNFFYFNHELCVHLR